MKEKLSQAKLEANRKNAKSGGASYAKKMAELKSIKIAEYNKNPKLCKHCQTIIPYDKKVNNFCTSSCSASFNNKNKSYDTVKKTWANKPKLNKTKSGHVIEPDAPYSKLSWCVCKHCKISFINRTSKWYCSSCNNLYSHKGRAKFWFTFNVFNYPDLFDLSLITNHGFRDNKTNPNGITRDHKVSVNHAIRNNYDPYYIKHPLNCELMFFNDNNKKKTRSSITYEELVRMVDEYDLNH